MKVRIAFATKPDGNGGQVVDSDRIGAVEDHPDEDAKRLIKDGIAAAATDQDAADWDAEQERRKYIADTEANTPEPEEFDLSSLTKDQMREQYPAAADQPSNATKADLIAAIEAAEAEQLAAPSHGEDLTGGVGGTIVTVAPDAESSPDVDPADRDSQ